MRIRQGNDFIFLWTIVRNGIPEDLDNAKNIRLHFKNFDRIGEVESFQIVDGNIVRVEVSPEWASRLGAYRLILSYEFEDSSYSDGDRKCVVDVLAFNIVPKTSEADDITEMAKTTDIMIGFFGLSAYEVWLKDNPGSTKEDYYNWLRQPATDAAESIGELEQTIEGNESLRVTAEQGRSDAELLRVGAEGIRNSNETDRINAEGIRDANETDRINAESDRVDAEDLRNQAEVAREEAEGLRQTNTATAIQNAEDATTAANTAAGLANNAATTANTAAGDANDAAEAANTAAGLANNAATAANTAAGLADNARLAIQDDLALKANHGYDSNPKTLKEVDDDLAQLESDVNLFKEESNLKDAIQDSKIKDIESIISTMNPNQSAQVSVSGVSPLSLPKNAANGGMSVKLEGLTAENLVVNGDFRNGLTGWKAYFTELVETDNNILEFRAKAKARVQREPPIVYTASDVIYMSAKVKATSDSVGIGRAESISIRHSGSGNWETLSYRGTPSNGYLSVVDERTSGWDSVFVKDYLGINLTATFGAGNEPTKEECDLMFADYFEGVKSFEPTGRIRSVGKNLVDSNLSKWESGNISPSGDNIPSTSRVRTIGYINVIPNTTYSRSGLKQVAIRGYDNNGLFTQDFSSSSTFTTGGNTSKLRLIVITPNVEDIPNLNIQLEKGATITPYEPYKETNLYLTAPELRSNGTVKDEIRKGTNGYELVKRISDVDGSVLTTPEIIPISYGGVLNSAESGTVYHEPIIADAGVYSDKMDILLTDYPIASIEEIIKHENGVDTYLNVASAVVASDGLSFTHPDLADGDLVLFTYAYDKESTNGNITATFYDSNVVKIDTVTGKAYKIEDVVTNGVLTRILTEV